VCLCAYNYKRIVNQCAYCEIRDKSMSLRLLTIDKRQKSVSDVLIDKYIRDILISVYW
jgi:hypothetical protein